MLQQILITLGKTKKFIQIVDSSTNISCSKIDSYRQTKRGQLEIITLFWSLFTRLVMLLTSMRSQTTAILNVNYRNNVPWVYATFGYSTWNSTLLEKTTYFKQFELKNCKLPVLYPKGRHRSRNGPHLFATVLNIHHNIIHGHCNLVGY